MTLITFQDGKAVMRDGKIGSEQECCCGCPCPASCERTISVTVSVDGMEATAVVGLPGAGTSRFDRNDGSGDFVEVNVTVVCGAFGPDGECGWSVGVGVCYQYTLVVGDQEFTIINGESFVGFVPLDSEWTDYPCPDAGEVLLECVPFGCLATVEASFV